MVNSLGKSVGVLVLIIGILSIAFGGFFVTQGFEKANLITEKMAEQKVTYGSADANGQIVGVIDTPAEAQEMANILSEHRVANFGYYTELKRDDPNRQQILNAMTMENSLQMAVLGYGLTDAVKGTGAFMILVGLTFGAISITSLRKKEQIS